MVRTPSLSLIGNKDKIQPLPSYMVRSTGKTYREIDILMVDSPVPLPGLAKLRIRRSSCIVLASKLRRCVRKELFWLKLQKNRMHNDTRLDPETKRTVRFPFWWLAHLHLSGAERWSKYNGIRTATNRRSLWWSVHRHWAWSEIRTKCSLSQAIWFNPLAKRAGKLTFWWLILQYPSLA